MEEIPFLVHKLSAIWAGAKVKIGLKKIQAAAYNGARTVIGIHCHAGKVRKIIIATFIEKR